MTAGRLPMGNKLNDGKKCMIMQELYQTFLMTMESF